MGETLAGWFWCVLGIYLAAGVLFAVPFVILWAGRLDTVARTGNWGFRLVILPGVAALWPLLLAKTLRARRGHYQPPDAEQAATAARLRRLHGTAFLILAFVVPVVCISALVSRPREAPSTVKLLPSKPLAQVLPLAHSEIADLPLEVTLRTDGTRDQVQLDVRGPLADPVGALYWSPEQRDTGVARDAVFLGSIWGPARLFFFLPPESRATLGVLTFIALSGDQHVLATLPLTRK